MRPVKTPAGRRPAILWRTSRASCRVAWGAQRSGLRFVAVSWHLSTSEAVYIARDSGARALVTSGTLAALANQVAARCPGLQTRLVIDGAIDGFEDFAAALAASSPERPISDGQRALHVLLPQDDGPPQGH